MGPLPNNEQLDVQHVAATAAAEYEMDWASDQHSNATKDIGTGAVIPGADPPNATKDISTADTNGLLAHV